MDYKKEEIKEYFDDYIKDNKEWLEENYPNDWKDDLHHYAFNEDYYIIGTYQAKQWLGDMAFDVIEFIKEYEMWHFGEVSSDFSSPEHVVNMYAYIIGEEIVNDYLRELEDVA
tara:strand:+ start:2344 stop:2682 length:339 start_codon:yes stop_codon:yes gene_type:complete